jgi:hypothetical protein
MIYNPLLSKKELLERVSSLKKLKYNKFRWWRMYDSLSNDLPNKSPLLKKIQNGDYNYSHYSYQYQLCEHELNDMVKKYGGATERFIDDSHILRIKRKKLMLEFEKDENSKLFNMRKSFVKCFKISEEEFDEEAFKFGGTLEDLYFYFQNKLK